jgi:hypothetical protein
MRLITALAVSLLFTGAAAASIVTSPPVELGLFNGPSINTVPAGSTNINGWTIGPDRVGWIGPFWEAGDWAMSVALPCPTPGSVSQTLTTLAGKVSSVSFLMAGNPDGAPVIKTLIPPICAVAPESFNFNATGASVAGMLWATKTKSFVTGGL